MEGGYFTLTEFSRLPREAADQLRAPLAAFCCGRGIKGTLLLAREGINGTVAGEEAAIAELIAHLEAMPEFRGLEVKYSAAAEMPFGRMKVRLKREIVATVLTNDIVNRGKEIGHSWVRLIHAPLALDEHHGHTGAKGPDGLAPVGPPWSAVAAKYKGVHGAEKQLTHTVMTGSNPYASHWKGKVSGLAMPPNAVVTSP